MARKRAHREGVWFSTEVSTGDEVEQGIQSEGEGMAETAIYRPYEEIDGIDETKKKKKKKQRKNEVSRLEKLCARVSELDGGEDGGGGEDEPFRKMVWDGVEHEGLVPRPPGDLLLVHEREEAHRFPWRSL